MKAAAVAAGCLALIGVGALAGQDGEVALLRCGERSARPCLMTTVSLRPEQARQLAGRSPDSLGLTWRARFLRDTSLAGRARRTWSSGTGENRVLVLVDVSGSMRNLGIGTAKLVVGNFLRTLDSLPAGSVRVAIAPFGSVNVAARIAAAQFTTPDSARYAIDGLPNPDRENTGLYSAVVAGVERLSRELAETGEGLGALVVLTDGDNDVGRSGDDAGLLAGASGLARAAQAVDGSAAFTTIVGIGNLNAQALTTLAGPRGRAYLTSLDAYELARPLAEVRDLFATSWELLFPLSVAREGLGRGPATLVPSVGFVAGAALWRPPVIALPAFVGVASSALVPEGVGAAPVGFVLDRRWPLALMAGVLLFLLWFVAPRLLWPVLSATPVQGAPPVKKAASPPPGGLRTDVKEVAPRRPSDVTAAKARRA